MKTFKEITEKDNVLMIVDALNLAFRWKHSGATEFVDDYIKTVDSLARSYKASQIIIACDKGSSTFRKSIYPEYKQNRKDKFETQTDAEKEAFEAFFKEFESVIATIEVLGEWPVLRYQGCEADDIAGYVVNLRKKLGFDHIWLISSDRDWDLLVKPDVSRFSYVTRKEVTWDTWNEHYDFSPEDYISIKCLTGDTGDNVKGIPSIGPKRAAELVKQYGTALDIIDAAPIPGKYKYIQSLNENVDTLSINYQLMDIETFCPDALGAENCNHIREVLGV